MPRIRAVHPSQAADPDFVELSDRARLFVILIRCLADDQGVVELKPRWLKMNIFPSDDWPVAPLIEEGIKHHQFQKFEVDGQAFLAIRNFRKWQKPRFPSAAHPLPADLRAYVGLDRDEDADQEGDEMDDGSSEAVSETVATNPQKGAT